MNMILILCALIIWLFGGYAEPTLPGHDGRARGHETDGLLRLRDRNPYRPTDRSGRLP